MMSSVQHDVPHRTCAHPATAGQHWVRSLDNLWLHTMNGSVEWMKVNASREVTAAHMSFALVPGDR